MEIIKITVDKEGDIDKRLDSYLSAELDMPRNRMQQLIKSEDIIVNGKKTKPAYKIQLNDVVEVNIPEVEEIELVPENIELDMVYEDADIAIINKQAGLVVHPAVGHSTGTLVNGLLYHLKDLSGINGEMRPGIVHRLDKDTSGLIMVAKNDNAHTKLGNLFLGREIEKTYLAIVKGRIGRKKGKIVTQIARDSVDRKRMAVVEGISRGKNAITNYEVISESEKYTLVKVRIETGRTHQIRVHMKYMGHPIVGDAVYGKASGDFKRQMLHAYNLKFRHPITGEEMDVLAELPEDFKKAMKTCGLDFNNILINKSYN